MTDVTVLLVEISLIKTLEDISTSFAISCMSDEKLHTTAAESEQVPTERGDLREKFKVFEDCKCVLNDYLEIYSLCFCELS